jgi:hypothetical protein
MGIFTIQKNNFSFCFSALKRPKNLETCTLLARFSGLTADLCSRGIARELGVSEYSLTLWRRAYLGHLKPASLILTARPDNSPVRIAP